MTAITVADAITSRRSIRSFNPRPVSEADVRDLLQAAVHAPTAMQREPWLFVVVQDLAALKRYSDRAKALLLKDAMSRDLHGPALSQSHSGFLEAVARPDFNLFYNAGTLILICARLTHPFVVADCWLAAENLMLAATGQGLGTCCIGSALPGLNSPETKTELAIPPDVIVVAAIVVGVPAEGPAPGGRKVPVILTWTR